MQEEIFLWDFWMGIVWLRMWDLWLSTRNDFMLDRRMRRYLLVGLTAAKASLSRGKDGVLIGERWACTETDRAGRSASSVFLQHMQGLLQVLMPPLTVTHHGAVVPGDSGSRWGARGPHPAPISHAVQSSWIGAVWDVSTL